MKKKIASLFLIIFMVFSVLPLASLAGSEPMDDNIDNSSSETEVDDDCLNIISETAVLMDADSGQVLFEKKMNKIMYPASITKILTGLIALERSQLNQVITMSETAVFSIERGSSHIALDMDEKITMEQALYGIAVASGNDAANGIAESVGGSLENFALMMNQRALKAGALNSNFTNAHGLPDEDHVSTAYDMACIMREAIKTPEFLEIFSELKYEIPPTNKQEEIRYLHNANCLINGVIPCEGIIAGKTGYTSASGHTLVTAARRNGRTLIVVVMNSSGKNDKFYDTAALFDYGFDHFKKVSISSNQIVKEVEESSDDGLEMQTVYYSENDVNFYLHDSLTSENIKIDYILSLDEYEKAATKYQQFGQNKENDDIQNDNALLPPFAVIELNSSSAEQVMYSDVIKIPLYKTSHETLTNTGKDQNLNSNKGSAGVGIAGGVEGGSKFSLPKMLPIATVAFLIVLWFVWYNEKKRRRRRKLQRLRQRYNVNPHRTDGFSSNRGSSRSNRNKLS